MNNVQEFLKAYYRLCEEYNMQFTVDDYYEFNIEKLDTTDILAKGVNLYFGIKSVDYLDVNNKLVEIDMN